MDWEHWARTFESSHDLASWEDLFAEGGVFRDPVTPWTTDLRSVHEQTAAIFPDWRQRVDVIRGGDDWAVFEWTGRATYRHPGAEHGVDIVMEGATVIEVDGSGKVTRWRDYLDTNEPTEQIKRAPLPGGDR